MGLGLFKCSEPRKSSGQTGQTVFVYQKEQISAPNPNPIKFEIEKELVVNGKSILLVKYFGCTTFNGKKLLLLKRKWLGGNSLDPHFLGKNHIVLARFEPNKLGWILAKKCAMSFASYKQYE